MQPQLKERDSESVLPLLHDRESVITIIDDVVKA